ncbi:hypothetical protein BBO99_00007631 [Phytophthora kernoviae]|uniref:Protein kinase domain-containing protein n=1 Tax=Phytophthora kernoviae TaxID=325452 RepID=A0A3R7KR68_9STRA|nr:hypothetical protein BBI17_007582 [Phytophthora kernoviae]RLN76337.1 hypothetical protein BBO99_00007631 [Phytophthora kernoviae]
MLLLLLLLALTASVTALAADVALETGFQFSGLHSDFAQQYYALYSDLSDVSQLPGLPASSLPDSIRSQLAQNSLKWDDLPGLLQRAVLWDAGYALTLRRTLAKVYTRCGRSMAEIVVPPKAFERAGCELRRCVLPDGAIFHRSGKCRAFRLARAVQCAVDTAEDISAPAYAAVWGDGGENDTLPEVTVQRHAYIDADDNTANLIFALHTTQYEVAYAQCPLTPAMVIPCASYNLVDQSKFCTPEAGDIAAAWLTKFAADHKQDQTWLLVPLCIVVFVTFGTVAVYRYKSALRDEARREVDLFMRENRHLFDNGAVEAFLVPKRRGKGKGRSHSARRKGANGDRQDRSSSCSSSSSNDSDDSAYSSRSSMSRSNLDRSPSLSYDEGTQNAAVFEHFDATIGLSASAFDPLTSAARVYPLQNGAEPPSPDLDNAGDNPDETAARRNEMAIQSFRLFESHRKIRRLRIPISELQLLRPLSRGTTGEVWLALHSNTQVVIKQLAAEKRRLLPEIEMFLAEIYLMAQLKHPHIVTLRGIAWNTLEHVIMVQEYMEGGDLQHFLAQQRTNNNGAPPSVNLGSGNTVVLHRDVKSRNVLLSSSLDAKLCDFGISRRKCSGNDDETNLTATAAAGTLSWTAPELLLGEEYSEKVDIYSLGVLFTELDTCTLPYHDATSLGERLIQHPLRLMRRIIDDGLRPQLSPDCPLPIQHLIAACMARNPSLRPSAEDVGAWLASARGERLLRKSSSILIP